jgi:MFS family permease
MKTSKNAYYAFALLFLLYMFDYIDRLIIVSLFPFLQKDWGLTDTECGLLISAVYWSILLLSFPASILVDRWSRKKAVGLMASLWSIATLMCVFTKNFKQLFSARIAIGIGEAGYAPGGTALISALFPPEKRARILGVWNASIPLGSAIGIALGGIIAEHLGWRHAFGIVAIPGFIFALMFFKVKDYKTFELISAHKCGSNGSPTKMSFVDIVKAFVTKKSLIFNNLAFASNVFVTTALLSWMPTYFHRMHDLPMSKAGPKAGLIMFMAIIGAPLGGYLCDRWMKRTVRARMLLPAISSAASALILFIAFGYLEGTLQYVALLCLGVIIIMFVPAAVSVTQDVIHPGLRAISLSINIVIQHTLGSPLGPLFVGMMSDRYDLNLALKTLPAFCLIAAILFFIGAFFYEADATSADEAKLVLEEQ